MKTLTIARHELAQQSRAFLAALLIGLAVLAAPLLPAFTHRPAHETLALSVVSISLTFAWCLAAIYGASMIRRDVEARRFSFYLCRPLGLGALFGGKVLAGLLLSVGTGLLVALPGALSLARKGLPTASVSFGYMSALALGGLLLMLLFHALAVSVRSRSPWVLLDLASLTLFLPVLWTACRHLALAGAFFMAFQLVIGALLAAIPALGLMGYAQVAGGRGDLKRGHRSLSLAGVGLSVLGSLGAWGYVNWVLNVDFNNLMAVNMTRLAPAGPWMTVTGPARRRPDFKPTLLVHTDTGRTWRIGSPSAAFSPEGTHAGWIEGSWYSTTDGPLTLGLADLGSPEPHFRSIQLHIAQGYGYPRLHLSSDGRRLLLRFWSSLEVHDTVSGRQLWALPWEGAHSAQAVFLSPNRLRILAAPDKRKGVAICEVDLDTGRRTQTGLLQSLSDLTQIPGRDPRTDRLLLQPNSDPQGDQRMLLCDAGTGAVLKPLGTGSTPRRRTAQFLSDGTIALVETSGHQHVFRLLDGEGREAWNLDLGSPLQDPDPRPQDALVLGEPAPGTVLLRLTPWGGGPGSRRLMAVDLARRNAQALDESLIPVQAWGPSHTSLAGPPRPGGLPTRLFHASKRLVLRAPDGALRPLAPTAAPYGN